MTPEERVAGLMAHLTDNVAPKLQAALQRGGLKCQGALQGALQWDSKRTVEQDIGHTHRCHVSVRLAGAEDAASTDDLDLALSNIESAIGYALVLHWRVWEKRQEEVEVEERVRFSEGDHTS
jgi:hypothetical protein